MRNPRSERFYSIGVPRRASQRFNLDENLARHLVALPSGEVIGQPTLDRVLLLLADIPGAETGATLKPGPARSRWRLQLPLSQQYRCPWDGCASPGHDVRAQRSVLHQRIRSEDVAAKCRKFRFPGQHKTRPHAVGAEPGLLARESPIIIPDEVHHVVS